MNRIAALAALALLTAWHAPRRASPSDLVGTWTVDLRSTPTSAPYSQPFVVTAVDGDSLAGTFYGSEVRSARLNLGWGAVRFAFTTRDGGGGAYHTSGVLRPDGTLEGTTHAVGRGFLAYWTAARAE